MIIGGIVLLAVLQASANPAGVPVDPEAPLTCITSGDGNWRIEAITGANGEFPVSVACSLSANTNKRCAEYAYTIEQLKKNSISHTASAVSADQDLDSAGPSAQVAVPGIGDPSSGFLQNAAHEYAITYNPNSSVFTPSIVVVEPSVARITTILITKGNVQESCLIAGPGVQDASLTPFTPIVTSQKQLAAGGKCEVELVYNAKGEVVDVKTSTQGCTVDVGPVIIDGEELRDNRSPTGITHGNNTCTTYGPPIPSPARTVCK